MNHWDEVWMGLCQELARNSKDRSTKIGAVIVNKHQIIKSTGWNGFPRNVDDTDNRLHERPTKYLWTVHAEINAICNAAAEGVSIRGCRLYTSMSSCSKCAPIIAQAGITEVISFSPDDLRNYQNTSTETFAKWKAESMEALEIFNACHVTVRFL